MRFNFFFHFLENLYFNQNIPVNETVTQNFENTNYITHIIKMST